MQSQGRALLHVVEDSAAQETEVQKTQTASDNREHSLRTLDRRSFELRLLNVMYNDLQVDPSRLIAPSPGKLVRYTVADGGAVAPDQAYAEVEVRGHPRPSADPHPEGRRLPAGCASYL